MAVNYPPQAYIPVPPELLAFAEMWNMYVIQINAQRFFGPPRNINCKYEPPSGSEVFVGKIPRDMYEMELVPILSVAGPIFQLRMMMDFSGSNRGYCFVKYFHPDFARRAVQLLNNTEVRPSYQIRVAKSLDNRQLLLGGVLTSKSAEAINFALSAFSPGVRFIWKRWLEPPKAEKGAVVVIYESHRAAALARSKILSNGLYLWGHRISVDWAEPGTRGETRKEDADPVILRVRNLAHWRSGAYFFRLLKQGKLDGVKRMRKYGSKAFIEFRSRAHAENARAILHCLVIDGQEIAVDWNDPGVNPPSVIFQSKKKKQKIPLKG